MTIYHKSCARCRTGDVAQIHEPFDDPALLCVQCGYRKYLKPATKQYGQLSLAHLMGEKRGRVPQPETMVRTGTE